MPTRVTPVSNSRHLGSPLQPPPDASYASAVEDTPAGIFDFTAFENTDALEEREHQLREERARRLARDNSKGRERGYKKDHDGTRGQSPGDLSPTRDNGGETEGAEEDDEGPLNLISSMSRAHNVDRLPVYVDHEVRQIAGQDDRNATTSAFAQTHKQAGLIHVVGQSVADRRHLHNQGPLEDGGNGYQNPNQQQKENAAGDNNNPNNQKQTREEREEADRRARRTALYRLKKIQKKVAKRFNAFISYLHFSDRAKERQFVIFNNQNDIEGSVAMILTICGCVFYYLNSYYSPQKWTFLFVMPLMGVVILVRVSFIIYGRYTLSQLQNQIQEAARDEVLEADPQSLSEALQIAAAAAEDPAERTARQQQQGNRAKETRQERRLRKKKLRQGREAPTPAQLKKEADSLQYQVAMWNERLVYIFIALSNIVCFFSYPNKQYCVNANAPIEGRDCRDSFWMWPGVYAVMLLYLFVSLPRLMPVTWLLVLTHTLLFISGRWLDTTDDSIKVYVSQSLLGMCIGAVAVTFLLKSEEMRREMFAAIARVERYRVQTHELQGRLIRHAAACVSRSIGKDLIAARGANCPVRAEGTIVTVRLAKFTEWCSNHSGKEISIHLRSLFAACDRAVLKSNVHHIITFGDLYVVVAGLDGKNTPFESAECGCVFAAAILNNRQGTLRIHISSGQISGVISSNPMVYQLFGHTASDTQAVSSNEKPDVTMCPQTRKLVGVDSLEEVVANIRARDVVVQNDSVIANNNAVMDAYSEMDTSRGGPRTGRGFNNSSTSPGRSTARGDRTNGVAIEVSMASPTSNSQSPPPGQAPPQSGTLNAIRSSANRSIRDINNESANSSAFKAGARNSSTVGGSVNGHSTHSGAVGGIGWSSTTAPQNNVGGGNGPNSGGGDGGQRQANSTSPLNAQNGNGNNSGGGVVIGNGGGPGGSGGGGGTNNPTAQSPPMSGYFGNNFGLDFNRGRGLLPEEDASEARKLYTQLTGERYYVYSDLQTRLERARTSHFKSRWQVSLHFQDDEIEDCFVRDVNIRVNSSSVVVAGSIFFSGLSLGCLVLLVIDLKHFQFRPATTLSATMFMLSMFGSLFMLLCVRKLRIDNALMLYFALMLVFQCGLASSPPGILTNNLQVWSMTLYLISYMLLPPGVITTISWLIANCLIVALPMSLMTILLDTFAVASTVFYHFATLLFLAYMHLTQEYSTRGRFLDTIYSYFLAKSLQAETLVLHQQLQIPSQALTLLGDATTVVIPKLNKDDTDPLNMYGMGGRLRLLDLELQDLPVVNQGVDETAIFVMQLTDSRGAAAALGRKLKKEPGVTQSAYLMRLCYAVCDDAIAKFGEGCVFRAKQYNGMIVLGTLRDNVPAVGHLARVVQDIYVRLHELRKEVVMTCTLAAGNLASAIVGDDFLTFEMYGDTLQTAMRVVNAAPPGSLTCSDRFYFIYECWQEEQLLVYEYYYEDETYGVQPNNIPNDKPTTPPEGISHQRSDEYATAKDLEQQHKPLPHQSVRNSVSGGKRGSTRSPQNAMAEASQAARASIKQLNDPAASVRKRQALAAAGASLSMSAAVQRKSIIGSPGAGGANTSVAMASQSQLKRIMEHQKRRGIKVGGGDGSGSDYPSTNNPTGRDQHNAAKDRPISSQITSTAGFTNSRTTDNLSGVQVGSESNGEVLGVGAGTTCPPENDHQPAVKGNSVSEAEGALTTQNQTVENGAPFEAAEAEPEEMYEEEYEEFSSPFEVHDPLPWKLRGRGVVAIRYVSVYSYEAKQ